MTENTAQKCIYQIAWQSAYTSGVERDYYSTRREAQHACQEKNKRYPGILHWVVAVDPETQTILS